MDSLHAIDASQQLFEQMPVAIAIFDGEMRYRAVSRRHLSDLAWLFSTEVLPPDQVIGRTFREISPDMPARWEDVHDRVLAGEELGQEEDLVPRKDGRAEWVRWHMSPWRDVHGRIGGASLITEVVTEQVEIRHALYESEARFRVTFENAPVGIAHLSLDFRWLRVNSAFCRIHGYTADELTTRSLRDIVPPDDFADLVARSEPMRAGTADRFETDRRALRKDGTIAWVRVSVSCLRKSDGTADYLVVAAEDITARKRTEEELADSEARFRATFENIAVGITHIARDGKYLRFNKAFSRLLDWPADELFTKSAWEVTHPDDLAFELGQFKKLEDGRIDSYSLDKRFLRKDGKTLWVRLTRSCVRKSDGSADYFVAVVEDITARKRAEGELTDSEARFRATFENAGVGISHVAGDGKFLRFNRALPQQLGWTADELLAKTFWEVGHPDDLALECAQFKQLADGRIDRYSVERRDLRKDGTAVWIHLTRTCVRKSDGSADYFVGVFEDITARKRTEEELADSEARFRATFENAAVGLSHTAPDGKFLRFNSALPRLLGWPAGELITKSVWEITHPDDLALERAQFKDLEDGRIESYSLEKRDLRKDGTTIWIRLTRSAVRKSDGSADYFVAVVEDISARKRAEEELRKSEERFRTSILLSPAPTILYDDREQILAVSQSWLAAAGISAGELNKMEDWTIRAYGTRSDEVLKSIRRIIVTEPVARPDELTVSTSSGDERLWNFVTSGLGTLSDGRRLFVSVAEDITDRRAYEERIHLLMREARHRTKNILGLVQAIARRTAAGGDAQDFIGRFTERIQALAANQDLLVRQRFQRIDVKDLVQVQLAHFADLIGTRIKFDGPKLHLNAAAAQAIGLALHELATNAGKYGALSTDAGGVDVRWQIDDDTFAMSWIERNGPPVRPPEHRGFGSTVIESMVKQTLGGDVQLDYAPSGLEWRLTCHAANALEETAKPVSTSSDAPSPANPSPR